MKYLLIFLVYSCFFTVRSQDSLRITKTEMIEMFKEINRTDNSNMNDTTFRYQIFRKNFERIVDLIASENFIDESRLKRSEKRIVIQGITRTLIHIFQIEPSLILNNNFIELIAAELKAERFSREYLVLPLSIYVYDNKINTPNTGELNNALTKWGIAYKEIAHEHSTFKQRKFEDVEKLFERTGFESACQFSISKEIDSSLFYCLKSIDLGLLPEVVLIHPDLDFVRKDSASCLTIKSKLYDKYLELYPSISKPKIGFELFQLYAQDQKNRSLNKYVEVSFSTTQYTFSIEKHNTDRRERISKTIDIIDDYGWLGYSEVGKKSGDALFLIIQHSYPEDNLLEIYLPSLIDCALNNEADKINAAKMIDRYLYRTKGVQIYGTQTICRGNGDKRACNVVPILDERNINDRRSKIGLNSIEEQCEGFGIEYQPNKKSKKIKKRYKNMRFLDLTNKSTYSQ